MRRFYLLLILIFDKTVLFWLCAYELLFELIKKMFYSLFGQNMRYSFVYQSTLIILLKPAFLNYLIQRNEAQIKKNIFHIETQF